MEWTAIAGAELAQATLPERLSWSRETGETEHVEETANGSSGGKARQEAILTLRVDPARALEIQYRSAQILERINSYFGYRAVGQLRVRQAPLSTAARGAVPDAPRPVRPTDTNTPDRLLEVTDEGLRSALVRMQQSIAARSAA